MNTAQLHAAAQIDPVSPFLGYGIVGAVAVILGGVVLVLYRRSETQHVAEREQLLAAIDEANRRADDERRRADRTQEELGNMIRAVQSDAMRAVTEANRAVTDALRRNP